MKKQTVIYYVSFGIGGITRRSRVEATSKRAAIAAAREIYPDYTDGLKDKDFTVKRPSGLTLTEHEIDMLAHFKHNKPVKIDPDFLTVVNNDNMNVSQPSRGPYGRLFNTSDIFYIDRMPTGNSCSLEINIKGVGVLYVLCRSLTYIISADN